MVPFALIRLAYVALVAGVPLAGLAALVLTRRPGDPRSPGLRRILRLAAAATLVLPLIGIYATWIEPYRLVTETAEVLVPAARSGQGEVRIGVLADIQTDRVTDHERAAVERVLALRPDLILLPGDLFQGTDEDLRRELPALRELLGRLSAPAGVFAVLGNTDVPRQVREILEGTPVRLLADEAVRVEVRRRTLTIGGLGENFRSPAARALLGRLEEEAGEGDLRVLVCHYPDAVLEMRPGSRIDLVVAGHTHGGQVRIPGFGPLMTLSRVPRRVAAGGLHDLEGRRIYVSRGVGWERGEAPRIRFFCPPEVSLITLGK